MNLDDFRRAQAQQQAQQQALLTPPAPQMGLQPRGIDLTPQVEAPAPVLSADSQYGDTAKAFSQGVQGIKSGLQNLRGLARLNVMGDTAGAVQDFQEAKQREDEAAQFGPRVQSLDDIHGAGDALEYARNTIAGSAPGLIGGVGVGALGRKVAEVGVGALARRAAEGAAERIVTDQIAKRGLTGVSEAVVKEQGKEAAEAVARRQLVDKTTDRILDRTTASAAPGMVGEAAGATVGSLPGTAAGVSQIALNPDGSAPEDLQSRANAALTGATISAGIGAVPITHFLERLGADKAAQTAVGSFASRLGKGVATQAAVQGGAGAAMSAVDVATHKYVDNNVDMLSPDSFKAYLNGLVGGAVSGAALGAVGEVGGSRVPRPKVGLRDAMDALKSRLPKGVTGMKVGDELPSGAPDLGAASKKAAASETAKPAFGDAVARGDIDEHIEMRGDNATSSADESAFDTFARHAKTFNDETALQKAQDDAESGLNDFLQNGTKQPTAPNAGVQQLFPEPDQRLQRAIAQQIPSDSPLWQGAGQAGLESIVNSVSKVFNGSKLTDGDARNLNHFRDAIGTDQANTLLAQGQKYSEVTKTSDKVIRSAGEDPRTAFGDELQRAMDFHARADAAPDPENVPRGTTGLPEGVNTATPEATPKPLDQLVSLPSENHTVELRKAARQQIAQETGGVIRTLPKERNGAWFDAKADRLLPVHSDDVSDAASKRGVEEHVDLPNVVNRKIAELGRQQTGEAHVSPFSALQSALGDLKLAGYKIKPSSFKEGMLYRTGKDGSESRLSERQADILRRAERPKPSVEESKRAPGDFPAGERPHVDESLAERPTGTHGDEERAGEQHKLTERSVPPGSGVAKDVEATNPYAGVVSKLSQIHSTMRHTLFGTPRSSRENPQKISALHVLSDNELANAKARAPSRAAEVDALDKRQVVEGRKIARAELQKQIDAGTISDSRVAATKERIANDREFALQHLRDAVAGKFDRASVDHVKADVNVEATRPDNDAKAARGDIERAFPKVKDDDHLIRTAVQELNNPPRAGWLKTQSAERDEVTGAIAKGTRGQKAKLLLENVRRIAANDAEFRGKFNEALRGEENADARAMWEGSFVREKAPTADELGIAHAEEDARNAARKQDKTNTANQVAENKTAPLGQPEAKQRKVTDAERRFPEGNETGDRKVTAAEEREFHDDLGEIAKTDGDKVAHDRKAEENFVNELAKNFGVPRMTLIHTDTHVNPGSGKYVHNISTMLLHNSLHGPERIEVMAHEFGHHVMESELASAPKEVQDAIEKGYNDWLENQDAAEDANKITASRKAYHRAQGMLNKESDPLASRTIGEINYILSKQEWVADHVARYLTSDAKPVGILGKFFSGLADKFKQLWSTITGANKDYLPHESVKDWMDHLYDRQNARVSEALGRTVSKEQQKTATTASVHEATEALYANFERASNADQSVPQDTIPPRSSGDGSGGGVGGKARLTNPPPNGDSLKAIVRYMRDVISPNERRVLVRAADKTSTQAFLREMLGDTFAKKFDDPSVSDEWKAAAMFRAWKDGSLKLGPESQTTLDRIAQQIRAVIGVAGNDDYAVKLMDDIRTGQHGANPHYKLSDRVNADYGKVQEAVDAARTVYEKNILPTFDKLLTGASDALRRSNVPALRRIDAMLATQTGEATKRESLFAAVTRESGERLQKTSDLFKDTDASARARVLDALQNQNGDLSGLAPDEQRLARRVLQHLFEQGSYLKSAGVNLKYRKNYYPVSMDPSAVAKDRQGFEKFFSQPHFEQSIRDMYSDGNKAPIDELVQRLYKTASSTFREVGEDQQLAPGFRPANPRFMQFVFEKGTPADVDAFKAYQQKDLAAVVDNYTARAVRKAEYVRRFGRNDGDSGVGERLTELLTKAREQGATDGQVEQARNLVDAYMGLYGADFSPTLQKLVGKPSPEARERARKIISGTMAYENLRSMPLALFSSITDPLGVFVRSGGDFKTAWHGAATGMKTLFSKTAKADMEGYASILGIAEEHTLNDALAGLYANSTAGAFTKKVNEAVFKYNGLNAWTRASRYMALAAAEKFIQKHAATPTAKDSARYLRELKLKPSDVQVGADGRVKVLSPAEQATASKAELAADQRVREAMNTFVNDAIVRVHAGQRPLWHSDPYFGLISQYKSYAYAFQQQILKRSARELSQGNARVLAPIAAYIPIAVLGNMAKGFVQYGPNGNPNQSQWGPGDYLWNGYESSGLLGPRASMGTNSIESRQYGSFFGSSLGPAARQIGQAIDAADGSRSASYTALQALPASAVYQHWF